MAFHRITYNEKYRFATLHNYGCTFRCPVCSYRLRSGASGTPGHSFPRPERFLTIREMEDALSSVPLETVYFMGGEPTVAKELPAMLKFAKEELGVRTFLGHTNGSCLPLEHLDGANVGLKAWDEGVHQEYTGRPKGPIFHNFQRSVEAGLEMCANIVLIPGLVEEDQVEAVARWLSELEEDIPFHIMGYIPVPGQPFRRPSSEEMNSVAATCRNHLRHVATSHLTTEEALDLTARDDRFNVRTIAGD
jgi:pyruvate formate lyase activating enzyme